MSIQKCEAIHFTKGRRKDTTPNIKIGDVVIAFRDRVRYLGVIFQKNLKWDPHIEMVVSRAKQELNVLREVSRVWWGADPQTLLTIFHVLVKSHFRFRILLL